MKKTIVAGTIILAAAASVPLVVWAESREHGHAMHGQERGMHHAGHRMMHGRLLDMIEAHDQDGDGALTQAEIDIARSNRLTEFDTDGDGKLSLAEYEKLWLDAMRERMVDRFQRHDDDGDGVITVEEFSKRSKRMVQMRDRNGDGVLSQEDLRRSREHRRERDHD